MFLREWQLWSSDKDLDFLQEQDVFESPSSGVEYWWEKQPGNYAVNKTDAKIFSFSS